MFKHFEVPCFCSKTLKWINVFVQRLLSGFWRTEIEKEERGGNGDTRSSKHSHQPSRLGFGHDWVWFSLLPKIPETFLSSNVESCIVILQTQAFPSGVSPTGVIVLGEGQHLRVNTAAPSPRPSSRDPSPCQSSETVLSRTIQRCVFGEEGWLSEEWHLFPYLCKNICVLRDTIHLSVLSVICYSEIHLPGENLTSLKRRWTQEGKRTARC